MKGCFPKVGAFVILGCCIIFLLLLLSHNTAQAHTNLRLITPTKITISTPEMKPTVSATATPTAIYVSQSSSSYGDPSVVIAIISAFISGVSLAFVVKYVIDTSAMAKATRESAEATRKSAEAAEKTLLEMKEAREEENAPFVIVYSAHNSEHMMLNIVVENIGKTVAKDIKLEFDPPLQFSSIFRKDDLDNNILLTNGIHSLVPNNKILIPFAMSINYFNEDRPMVYAVKVSYFGRDTLPKQEIRYDLDLNHYRYQFIDHEPVAKIATAMESMSRDFYQYTEYFKALLQDTNDISNVLSRNLARTSYAIQRQKKVDVMMGLKDFVLTWSLYGKDKKLLLNPFLFDLRSKCLLLSEEILRSTTESADDNLNKAMQDIGVKLCRLGNVRLTRDGYVTAHSIQGSSIEDFNDLGDEILADVRNLLQPIEQKKEKLSDNNEENGSMAIQESETFGKS